MPKKRGQSSPFQHSTPTGPNNGNGPEWWIPEEKCTFSRVGGPFGPMGPSARGIAADPPLPPAMNWREGVQFPRKMRILANRYRHLAEGVQLPCCQPPSQPRPPMRLATSPPRPTPPVNRHSSRPANAALAPAVDKSRVKVERVASVLPERIHAGERTGHKALLKKKAFSL
jgi:hypothetical protein